MTRRKQNVSTALVALAVGLTGCAEATTKNEPDSPDAESAAPAKKKPKVAKVGDAITLRGNDEKLRMRVKLLRVKDPVKVGEFDQPGGNSRFVGVYLLLTNVGDASYSDSPSNGATLINKRDEQFNSALVSGGPCSGGFASSSKIAPGAKRRGCIPFEVKGKSKLATFQFALDSGFAPGNGEWRISP